LGQFGGTRSGDHERHFREGQLLANILHMNDVHGFLAEADGPVRLLIYGELMLFVVILTARRASRRFLPPLLLLVLSLGCYLYLSGPWSPVEGVLRLAFIGLTSLTPFTLWALALLFFDDRFQLPRWTWPVAAAVCTISGLLELSGTAEVVLRNGMRIVSLAALLHAIWVMVSGLRDDLVARRRLARVIIVGLVLLQAGASLITELLLPDVADRAPFEPVSAIIILLLTTCLSAALLRPELPEMDAAATSDHAASALPEQAVNADDPLATSLAALVKKGGLLEPGMTISVLAGKLGVPEYRLRQTINQKLGFRNFSSFLNHHRIAEAQRRLRDPAMARLPVLTIAMDMGYGSLGPFNRAFREACGMTPTDFRRRDHSENLADS
jgi:AraC-like DNA-binding protein